MKPYKNLFFALVVLTPVMCFAQAETIFNDVLLNESFETTSQKLADISGTMKVISVENPTFPLAKTKEQHLICSQLKTRLGTIDKAVFTFADDTLHYILAKGNAYPVFTEKRTDTALVYLDYEVYFADKLFVKKKEDMALIISEEATHPNLFVWENPYLDAGYKKETTPTDSYKIPAFLTMGASLDEIKPLLEANSAFTNTEELDGSDPNAQLQINCFGVEYAGFPRKIEARFGDNKLNVVWILTGKGEEGRIREALMRQYGKPIYMTEEWEIFNNWQVGLRKDKPEVLLMEQQIGLGYKKEYFKQ